MQIALFECNALKISSMQHFQLLKKCCLSLETELRTARLGFIRIPIARHCKLKIHSEFLKQDKDVALGRWAERGSGRANYKHPYLICAADKCIIYCSDTIPF